MSIHERTQRIWSGLVSQYYSLSSRFNKCVDRGFEALLRSTVPAYKALQELKETVDFRAKFHPDKAWVCIRNGYLEKNSWHAIRAFDRAIQDKNDNLCSAMMHMRLVDVTEVQVKRNEEGVFLDNRGNEFSRAKTYGDEFLQTAVSAGNFYMIEALFDLGVKADLGIRRYDDPHCRAEVQDAVDNNSELRSYFEQYLNSPTPAYELFVFKELWKNPKNMPESMSAMRAFYPEVVKQYGSEAQSYVVQNADTIKGIILEGYQNS